MEFVLLRSFPTSNLFSECLPMTAQTWKWSHECSFASDMKTAHELIDLVMGKLSAGDWTTKETFAINLALEEALVNAVQHGNKSDLSKTVHFACRLSNNHVCFRIEDEGEGFDPNAVPDPTDEEHIMVASGRGVLLIRSFVSNVRWNEKGNVLEFEKEHVDN